MSTISGTPATKVKTFLDGYAGFFPSDAKEWEVIHWVEQFRHIIIHNNGTVPRGKKEKFFSQIVDREMGVFIDNNRCIHFTSDFINRIIKDVKSWFEAVFLAIGLEELEMNIFKIDDKSP